MYRKTRANLRLSVSPVEIRTQTNTDSLCKGKPAPSAFIRVPKKRRRLSWRDL